MICAIMQPTYLPWAGGFDLLDQVDVFAFYDDVQVVRRSWDVRNRIKTANGELFLTIPIRKTSHRDETVFTTALIDDSRSWRKEHLAAIGHSYRKAVHFDEVFAFVEALIQVDLGVLADFNIHLITSIARRMGMTADLVRVSSLPECAGRKDARLVNICRRLSADAYLSPFGAHAYIERETPGGAFAGSGVALAYQQYEPVPYPQLHGAFASHMCVLDLLFNVGFERSAEVIRAGRRPSLTSQDCPPHA